VPATSRPSVAAEVGTASDCATSVRIEDRAIRPRADEVAEQLITVIERPAHENMTLGAALPAEPVVRRAMDALPLSMRGNTQPSSCALREKR
jgi:hypothetical protein